MARYTGNSGDATQTVGTKAASEIGIYDMNGNVWEWCWDWYGAYPSAPQNDPIGPASGSYRVNRGGSGIYDAYGVRSADRGSYNPSRRYNFIGFRVLAPTQSGQ